MASSPLAAALLTFVIAALLTALIVPLVRWMGLRYGLFDPPDSRKQHDIPMVRLGGIGMVVGFPWPWRSPGPWEGSAPWLPTGIS